MTNLRWKLLLALSRQRREQRERAAYNTGVREALDRLDGTEETAAKLAAEVVPCTACDYGYPTSACSATCDCGAC